MEVPAREADFQPDIDALRAAITERTRAVVINSPNNPVGTVYSRESLEALAALLRASSEQYGTPLYLVSDEPYREIAYAGVDVPWVPSIYENTIVCYSYSKSCPCQASALDGFLCPLRPPMRARCMRRCAVRGVRSGLCARRCSSSV